MLCPVDVIITSSLRNNYNESVNGRFSATKVKLKYLLAKIFMDSCENVTFLVLRNTWFLTIWEFFPNSHSKMFFNKIEIVMVFDWLQPCTGYIAYKKPFCLIFRIPTLRLLSSHWSGLLISSLIGPLMITGHMTLSDFPILSLTYTAESVNIRFCYLLLLFTIYLQFLFTFRRLRRKYKIQRFCVV